MVEGMNLKRLIHAGVFYGLCLLALLALLAPAVEARTVKLATTEFHPFSSQGLQQGGFETALIRAAFEASGYDVQVDFLSWKRALKNVEKGEYDVIAGIYFSEERNQRFEFSKPVYYLELGLVALGALGVERFDSLSDLTQYRIGVVDGSIISNDFDHANYLNKVKVHSDSLNIAMLYKQRIDLVATSFFHFRHEVMASEEFDADALVYLQPSLAIRPVHIAVSRATPEHAQLRIDFDRGLEMIRRSGRYEAVLSEFGMTGFRQVSFTRESLGHE